jgi:hypothetical protein
VNKENASNLGNSSLKQENPIAGKEPEPETNEIRVLKPIRSPGKSPKKKKLVIGG